MLYLLLSLATLVMGYFYLRYAYHVTDKMPFTQEIVLVILGTLATIFITGLLLNKQSAVEIEKEQNIRFLELKMQTYQQLLDLLEEMSLLEKFTNKEIIRLQFVTHKLAVVAAEEVIVEYQHLLNTLKNISQDSSFSGDMHQLHEALGNLTLRIRKDILGANTATNINTIIQTNAQESLLNE